MAWTQSKAISVNVAGTWQPAKAVYVNIGGVWKLSEEIWKPSNNQGLVYEIGNTANVQRYSHIATDVDDNAYVSGENWFAKFNKAGGLVFERKLPDIGSDNSTRPKHPIICVGTSLYLSNTKKTYRYNTSGSLLNTSDDGVSGLAYDTSNGCIIGVGGTKVIKWNTSLGIVASSSANTGTSPVICALASYYLVDHRNSQVRYDKNLASSAILLNYGSYASGHKLTDYIEPNQAIISHDSTLYRRNIASNTTIASKYVGGPLGDYDINGNIYDGRQKFDAAIATVLYSLPGAYGMYSHADRATGMYYLTALNKLTKTRDLEKFPTLAINV